MSIEKIKLLLIKIKRLKTRIQIKKEIQNEC